MPEMTWLDATAQADLVRRGEVSPKELAEAAIARIEAVNPQLDAVIRTRFDEARLEADDDLPDGAFRGVPILFKDLGCTVAGEPTAFGVGPMREVAWPVTSYLASTGVLALPPPEGEHVPGCVHVPVVGRPACCAGPGADAERLRAVPGPACRAQLRGRLEPAGPGELPAVPAGLVLQHRGEG
jgi:hypothetical protein